MSLFVVDTGGDDTLLENEFNYSAKLNKTGLRVLNDNKSALEAALNEKHAKEQWSDEGEDFFGLPPPNINLSNIISETLALTEPSKTGVDLAIEGVNEKLKVAVENAENHKKPRHGKVTRLDWSTFDSHTGKFEDEELTKTDIQKELMKATMEPSISTKKRKLLNKLERSKFKGKGWYDLPATEMTPELKNEMEILRMRSVLDPKHFYKKNDLKVLPKYFQVGTVQHSHLDYYSERGTRKNKRVSLVDELLDNDKLQKYHKKKYQEITANKEKYKHRKAMKKMKKLKKK